MKKNCKKFQELLISDTIEPLSSNERHDLFLHINNCNTCKTFLGMINGISHFKDNLQQIKPDKEVYNALVYTLMEKQSFSQSISSLFANFKNFLMVRIPLYQAVAFLFLIVIISYLKPPTFHIGPDLNEKTATEELSRDQFFDSTIQALPGYNFVRFGICTSENDIVRLKELMQTADMDQ